MNGRPRADIDELAFRRDWDAGLTLAELAAMYGVSASTITNYSVRFRCSARTPGRKRGSYTADLSPHVLTDGEWVTDRLGVQRWEAGPEPARKPAVKRIPGPPRGPRIEIDEDEFRQLWDYGLPLRVLAERYGCSKTKIGELARKLGCSYRTPGRRSA